MKIMDTQKTDRIVKDKVNKELLKRQTEIALKISNYSHYTSLVLAIIFKFILEFDSPLPYIFFAYFVVSQANTLSTKTKIIKQIEKANFTSYFIKKQFRSGAMQRFFNKI